MTIQLTFPPVNLEVFRQGRTTSAGNIGGTTIVDTSLLGVDIPVGTIIVLYTDSTASVTYRGVLAFDGVSTITLGAAAPAQILSGVAYALAVSAAGLAGLPTSHGFQEQLTVPVTIALTAVMGETNVLLLNAAATHYILRNLRLKTADPGADTITVKLYELVNNILTVVDTDTIVGSGGVTPNWTTYFSLMDLHGLQDIVGDQIRITVTLSANGPYALTGQYSYGAAV